VCDAKHDVLSRLVLSLTRAKKLLRFARGREPNPILSTLPEALVVMGQITIEPPVKATEREPYKLTTAFTMCSPSSPRNDQIAIASTNHLKSCSHSELRKLCCKTERGRLIICGQVSSYYWKQLAQETIRPLSQSLCIENHLDVRSAVSNNSQRNPSEY
jgi:hypothetical protein